MTYNEQLNKGLVAYACFQCSTFFWIRPESAQKVEARGKELLCRVCQDLRSIDVAPYPYSRRLTKEEAEDHEWELHCQELKSEQDAIYHPQEDELSSLPPSPMDAPSPELLRLQLKNSLEASDTSPSFFASAAGIAYPSLKRFLDDSGERATQQRILDKIVTEMKKRDWLHSEPVETAPDDERPSSISEIIEGFRQFPVDLHLPAQRREPSTTKDVADAALTPDEQLLATEAILKLDCPRAERFALVRKLFPL